MNEEWTLTVALFFINISVLVHFFSSTLIKLIQFNDKHFKNLFKFYVNLQWRVWANNFSVPSKFFYWPTFYVCLLEITKFYILLRKIVTKKIQKELAMIFMVLILVKLVYSWIENLDLIENNYLKHYKLKCFVAVYFYLW